MSRQLGIRVRDYYDLTPCADNAAGDIWSGLPIFGLLGTNSLSGIVITPACDLSNRKVETITYLPIITVRAYFATPAFLPELLREIDGQLQVAQASNLFPLLETHSRFFPPPCDALEVLESELQVTYNQPNISSKVKLAIERVQAGLRILYCVANPEVIEPQMEDVKCLLGEKLFTTILQRIVTNAYRLDIHFLPADEQIAEWSGIFQHSLALFRYALSAPVEIFECAQDVSLIDWEGAMDKLAAFIPGTKSFASIRPMKKISLKPRFLADLLTRYVAMHVRIGSPDFTSQTVSEYVDQIGKN